MLVRPEPWYSASAEGQTVMRKKAKIIISDLHLGAGRSDEGNLLEDFHSDDAFAQFLSQLAAESQQQGIELELIVAGDMFEFLQVPALTPKEFDPAATYPIELYDSSAERDSSRKMQLIIAGHTRFFAALREFVQASFPRRRLTIIKGNHDVNLHWLEVQERIRAALDATRDRAYCLAFEERRVSGEGLYVEHGHQYCERVNRFPDFEEPHDPNSPEQLYLPVGSRFVFTVFNELERQLYWVDGVKPLTALVWYAFALDPGLAVRALWTLLRRAPALVWEGFPLRPADEPDLETLEVVLASLAHLRHDLEDGQVLQSLKRDARWRGAFYERLDAVLSYYGTRWPRELREQPRAPVRAALARGWAQERAQHMALAKVARHKRLQERARVIVFGHTHTAGIEELEGGAVYLNSGTWTWVRDFSGDDYSSWQRLFKHPERFTSERRLSYVRVDYMEDGTPVGHLKEFRLPEQRRPTARVFHRPRPLWKRFCNWIRR